MFLDRYEINKDNFTVIDTRKNTIVNGNSNYRNYYTTYSLMDGHKHIDVRFDYLCYCEYGIPTISYDSEVWVKAQYPDTTINNYYEVSSLGRVKNILKNSLIEIKCNPYGNLFVYLTGDNNKTYKIALARLMYNSFNKVENIREGTFTFKDYNPLNCTLDNINYYSEKDVPKEIYIPLNIDTDIDSAPTDFEDKNICWKIQRNKNSGEEIKNYLYIKDYTVYYNVNDYVPGHIYPYAGWIYKNKKDQYVWKEHKEVPHSNSLYEFGIILNVNSFEEARKLVENAILNLCLYVTFTPKYKKEKGKEEYLNSFDLSIAEFIPSQRIDKGYALSIHDEYEEKR